MVPRGKTGRLPRARVHFRENDPAELINQQSLFRKFKSPNLRKRAEPVRRFTRRRALNAGADLDGSAELASG